MRKSSWKKKKCQRKASCLYMKSEKDIRAELGNCQSECENIELNGNLGS